MGKTAEPFKPTVSAPWWVKANPLAWTLWGMDFLIWTATVKGPVKMIKKGLKGKRAVVVSGQTTRRLKGTEDKLHTSPIEGKETALDLLEVTYEKYANNNALGTRRYVGTHQPEHSKIPLQMFAETSWITFKQCDETSKAFGAGLIQLGMQPLPVGVDYETHTGPSTMMIYEDTSKEWTLAAHGCFSQSICVATSYATLGMDALAHTLNETNCAVIFCNNKKVAEVCGLASKCPKLKTIIYSNHMCPENTGRPDVNTNLQVLSFEEVVAMGRTTPKAVVRPTKDTMALLMYTSGSTGQPKGVMQTHAAIVAAVAGGLHHFKDFASYNPIKAASGMMIGGLGTHLAYLPAAHIMEFTAQLTTFVAGSAIGFACPKTISSKGACRQRPDGTINTTPGYPYPPGGIQEFRPSLFVGAPKIWDVLKKGIEDTIGNSSPVVRFLFLVAYAGRARAVAQGRESPLFKATIFKKVSVMMGGNLENAVSGGGPCSSEVQTFVRTVFGCNMLQGYGLTETCSGCTIQQDTDCRDGVVGVPLSSFEIKLLSTPEILDREGRPYLDSDTMHLGRPCAGRGEVLIKGKPVSVGYFKQPKTTAAAFQADGFFRSGDIGIWTPDGSLMLVDRVKNLIKLKGGEYIALESMEKEYSTSKFCAAMNGGVMCYGNGDMDRPVALFQADMLKVEEFAKEVGLKVKDPEELCKDPQVIAEVMRTLDAAHKSGGLARNEKLAAVYIIPGTGSPTELTPTSPWNPDNGALTASHKMQRRVIEKSLECVLVPVAQQGIF